MADQILDVRTLLWDAGDGTGGDPDDLAGSPAADDDTSTFIQGSISQTLSITNSVLGRLFDAGTAQNWSNNTFWLWVNCGVVGLLNAKAAGGMTVRFCGATVTDWFEVYVAGNDSYPITFEGGWAVFVIDIEDAHTNSDATGGTKPATSAIRYVGMTAETSIMPKMADNFWMDAIYRNPTASPAWTVEGQNGGSTDWTFADVATELTVASGLVLPIDGDSFYVTGPGQFGIADSETHGFTSLNDTILWSDQEFVLDGFYKLSAVGDSGGVTNVTFGAKSGSGDDATGSQGASIKSGSANARFDLDFNDPDLDSINFYGCSLIHGGDFLLDDPAVSFISTLFIDCDSALVSNAEILRCSIIEANTADGVAFMTTDKLDDIVFCTFEFSDGHGVELTTPNTASHASKGNVFTSYGTTTSNDAALYNNSGSGLVTINVTDGGSDITYRDGTSATTAIVLNPVTLILTVLEQDGTPVENARVLVRAGATGNIPYLDSVTIDRTGSVATVAHTAHGMINGQKVKITGADQAEYNGVKTITNVVANEYDYTVTGSPTTPATGTIISTGVIVEGLTDSSGEISDTRVYTADQEIDSVRSHARKSSAADDPKFQTSPISGTILSASGFAANVLMIPDQ